MIRFKNLVYSHTDEFHNDEYVVKLVADFNIEEIQKAGLPVDDSYNLVIEITFSEGKQYAPTIWDLEWNEFIDVTPEEEELIIEFYNKWLSENKG